MCPHPFPGVLGCSLVLSVQAFYSASDDVIVLTPSNFNKEVIQSDSLWLVEFYAPWWVHRSWFKCPQTFSAYLQYRWLLLTQWCSSSSGWIDFTQVCPYTAISHKKQLKRFWRGCMCNTTNHEINRNRRWREPGHLNLKRVRWCVMYKKQKQIH